MVERTERKVQAATALLIDLSLSMPMRGNWVAAKKVAARQKTYAQRALRKGAAELISATTRMDDLTRAARLSEAEHELIREVHPQVGQIKEHVETVKEAVSPEKD